MSVRSWITAAIIAAGFLAAHEDSFANCNPPKFVSNYNYATGVAAYWILPPGYPSYSGQRMRMWQLGNRAGANEGFCNFLGFSSIPQPSVYIAGDLGQSCFNGCPSGRLVTVASVVSAD